MKTNHLLTIDHEVWVAAKSKGLNVSAFLENALRNHLKLTSTATDKPSYQKRIDRLANIGRPGVIGEAGVYEIHRETGVAVEHIIDYCNEKCIEISY